MVVLVPNINSTFVKNLINSNQILGICNSIDTCK